MFQSSFNNIDIAILVIFFFSGLTAFFRGFSKEVFSILGWILAAFITSRGLVFIQPIFRDMIKTAMIADFAASASLFIGTTIIWAIITGKMTKRVRKSSLSNLDKIFGLIFGLIRAVILITLAYVFINFLLPKENMPKIITEARLFVYVEKLAEVFAKAAPEQIESIKGSMDPKKYLEQNIKNDIYEKLIQPSIKGKEEEFKGYDKKERESLDDLIEKSDFIIEDL